MNDTRKKINLREGISLVVGLVIGSGVFFKASFVFQNAGSPAKGILAWVLGGIITICSGLSIAEVASAIPETGGLFVYLKVLYGDVISFLFGWVQVVIASPGIVAASIIIFSEGLANILHIPTFYVKIIAIIIIILLFIGNILSSTLIGKVQFISTIAKLIPLLFILIFALINGKNEPFATTHVSSSLSGFGTALLGTLWAYDGWISVTTISGEIENPRKNVPKSIIIGLSIIISIYVFFNFALLKVLPFNVCTTSTKIVEDAAYVLFGNTASTFISISIMLSVFGAFNGEFMASSRLPYAMAKNNLFPFKNIISKEYGKYKIPYNSLIIYSIFCICFILTGSFETLTELVVFSLWMFFILGVLGVFIVRKRGLSTSGYKVPFYPIVPIIGALGGSFILINTLFTCTSNALIGLILTSLGLPIFYLIKKFKL